MVDEVEVQTKVAFVAWPVPDEVRYAMPERPRQEGFQPLPALKLGEVDPSVIDALASKWLDHLYASIGMKSPFTRIGQQT